MLKNGEILPILNKQVYILKIADFPEYIRVDNTERWLLIKMGELTFSTTRAEIVAFLEAKSAF